MPYVAPPTPANPQPAPISRYSARSSYYGASGYSPSEGLQRARKPFRAKNALTGLGIMAFVGAVYGYSISAVKQDDFSDLPTTSTAASGKTIEEEMAERAAIQGSRGIGAMMGMGSSPQGEGSRMNEAQRIAQAKNAPNSSLATAPSSPTAAPLPASAVTAPAGSTIDASTSPLSASSRPKSRLVIGAPNVDRLGRLGERPEESTVGGRRLV